MGDIHLAQKWQHKFGFIDKAELTGTYIALLALARSKRDVQRLHALLPDNCRLLRAELIELVKFWEKMYGETTPPQGSKRIHDAVANWMLRSQRSFQTLHKYYRDKIHEGKNMRGGYWNFPPDFQRVCHSEILDHFNCEFMDHVVAIFFSIKKQIELHVSIKITLSEPVAHSILSLENKNHEYSGSDPLIFVLPAEEILDHFEAKLSDTDCSGYIKSYIAKPSFCRAVERKLNAAGIPVSNIRRHNT